MEGGLIITQNPDFTKKNWHLFVILGLLDLIRFQNWELMVKTLSFTPLLGLANLKYTEEIHNQRKKLSECYDKNLKP